MVQMRGETLVHIADTFARYQAMISALRFIEKDRVVSLNSYSVIREPNGQDYIKDSRQEDSGVLSTLYVRNWKRSAS